MKSMLISEFKAKCIATLKNVQRTGTPVVVTRRGKPVAQVVPMPRAPERRTLGTLRGRLRIRGDLVHSGFSADWEALR